MNNYNVLPMHKLLSLAKGSHIYFKNITPNGRPTKSRKQEIDT